MTLEFACTTFEITRSAVSTRVTTTAPVRSEPPSGETVRGRKYDGSCCHGESNFFLHPFPYSQDGQYILCGSEDNYIYVWKTYHDYGKLSSARRDRNDCYESFTGNLELRPLTTPTILYGKAFYSMLQSISHAFKHIHIVQPRLSELSIIRTFSPGPSYM